MNQDNDSREEKERKSKEPAQVLKTWSNHSEN